jgi:hypothetical protein
MMMYAIAYVMPFSRARPFTHVNAHEVADEDETRTCEFPAVQVGEGEPPS